MNAERRGTIVGRPAAGMSALRCLQSAPDAGRQRSIVVLLLVALLALAGCENSILRNAAEAGVEAALEAPPTPTP
ncbi:MAG: hypothetical protein HY270_11855 [Deltaproteobacteria bacterium]|nr:hypothetical protein [Deltaproteobacteria bacterium]